jgi:tetratricopeptide (TPR) repeat protein
VFFYVAFFLNGNFWCHLESGAKWAQKETVKTENSQNSFEYLSSTQLYQKAKSIIINALPGEYRQAEKLLIESIRQDPKNMDSYIELAKLIQTQVTLGNKGILELQKSILLIRQAYELAPERPRARFAYAEILYYSGLNEKAQELYAETLSKYPEHPETFIEKSKIFSEKKPQESIENAKKALQKGVRTDEISPYVIIAITKLSKENLAENLEHFAVKYPDRWLWHKAGLAYKEAGHLTQAKYAFEQALELGNQVESRLQLAVMQYTEKNESHQAIDHFKKLLHILSQKEFVNVSALSLVYAHLSLAFYKIGSKQEASIAATYSAQTSQGNKDFYSSLISEYKQLNALFIAENSLKYLLKEDPAYVLPYITYGEIYRTRKKYEISIEMYTKALSLEPQKEDLYAQRGISYYKKDKYLQALKDFESALLLKPNTPIYIYNKACMLALLGKKSEAIENLKFAFKQDKKLIDLARVDNDFISLKSDLAYAFQFTSLVGGDFDHQPLTTELNSK